MSENKTKQSPEKASASTDVGQTELQKVADEAAEKGYIGTTPETTPNEEFTVAGVVKKAKDGK